MARTDRLCDYCGRKIRSETKGSYCSKECFHKDTSEETGDEFEPCSDCDGHDACSDYGCAIKLGLGEMVQNRFNS